MSKPTLLDMTGPDVQPKLRHKLLKGMADGNPQSMQLAMMLGIPMVMQRSATDLATGQADPDTVLMTAHCSAYFIPEAGVDGDGPVLASREVRRGADEPLSAFRVRLSDIADELRTEGHGHPENVRPKGLGKFLDKQASDIATEVRAIAIAMGVPNAV